MLTSYDLATIVARLSSAAEDEAPAEATSERHGSDRWAAVAAILRQAPTGDAEILFMCRAERPGDPWSGHMAFPGGRHEARDPTLLRTAVRETLEEVGLDLDTGGTFLARLPPLQAMANGRSAGLRVVPFVFALDFHRTERLVLNHEVAAAMWAPLGPLARGEATATVEHAHGGATWRLPGLRVGDRVVWGLTYRMMEILFERLHATVR